MPDPIDAAIHTLDTAHALGTRDARIVRGRPARYVDVLAGRARARRERRAGYRAAELDARERVASDVEIESRVFAWECDRMADHIPPSRLFEPPF